MKTSEKNQLVTQKMGLCIALMVFLITIMVGCGDDTSALIGKWVEDDGSKTEFFKDGTGITDGKAFNWKNVDNKRLIITYGNRAIDMDYKISGSKLTLNVNGKEEVLVKAK